MTSRYATYILNIMDDTTEIIIEVRGVSQKIAETNSKGTIHLLCLTSFFDSSFMLNIKFIYILRREIHIKYTLT